MIPPINYITIIAKYCYDGKTFNKINKILIKYFTGSIEI